MQSLDGRFWNPAPQKICLEQAVARREAFVEKNGEIWICMELCAGGSTSVCLIPHLQCFHPCNFFHILSISIFNEVCSCIKVLSILQDLDTIYIDILWTRFISILGREILAHTIEMAVWICLQLHHVGMRRKKCCPKIDGSNICYLRDVYLAYRMPHLVGDFRCFSC